MKVFFLLVTVLLGTHAIEPFEPNYLISKIKEKDKTIKNDLLNQFVALAWGYKNFNLNYTSDKYLEEMAEYVMEDYLLTTRQKVNSFTIRYVLTIFGKAIFNQQHLSLVEHLIRLKLQNNGKIPENFHQHEYGEEMNMANEFSLTEGEIAMDLLIQSFAPPSLSPKEYIKGKDLSNYDAQKYTIMRRRAAGAYVLVNSLLDPPYKLKFNGNFAISTTPEIILKYLEKQAYLNFEKFGHSDRKPWSTGQWSPIGFP